MSMSVGASSNALSYLQSLLQQGKSGAGGSTASDPLSMLLQTLTGDNSAAGQTSTATASSGTATGASSAPFGSDTFAALLSAQGQPANRTAAEQKFFNKLDSDGDGSISKSEFETAAGKAGVSSSIADAVFSKIDTSSNGSISLSELTQADHGGHRHHHGIGGGGGAGQGGLDTLLSGAGADGATTQTATNADGSSTTTITYADGSTIDMTTPAKAASDSGSANSGSGNTGGNLSANNLLEQLFKMQSQMLAASAPTSTVSAIA